LSHFQSWSHFSYNGPEQGVWGANTFAVKLKIFSLQISQAAVIVMHQKVGSPDLRSWAPMTNFPDIIVLLDTNNIRSIIFMQHRSTHATGHKANIQSLNVGFECTRVHPCTA
jgi:hypothetical protein